MNDLDSYSFSPIKDARYDGNNSDQETASPSPTNSSASFEETTSDRPSDLKSEEAVISCKSGTAKPYFWSSFTKPLYDSNKMSEGSVTQKDSESLLSRDEIVQKGALFSSAEFRKVAGPPNTSFFRSRSYQILLGALEKYQELKEAGSPKELPALITLKKRTEEFLEQTTKATPALLPSFVSTRLSPQKNEGKVNHAQAATLLLNGIEEEAIRQRIGDFTEEHEDYSKTQENFASGNMASVSMITYQDGLRAVFKPVRSDEPMNSIDGRSNGIPAISTLRAGLALRSVASSKVDQYLGFHQIPKTELASHDGQLGSCQLLARGKPLYKEEIVRKQPSRMMTDDDIEEMTLNASQGQPMPPPLELIVTPPLTKRDAQSPVCEHGIPISESRAEELMTVGEIYLGQKRTIDVALIDFSNPSLQQSMSKAHLLDILTGQLDRNPGNFFYHSSEKGWAVDLIDNDLSFPEKFRALSPRTLENLAPVTGPTLKELPRLIDKEAAEKIEQLQPEDLQKILQEAGLTDNEIEATLGRLKDLKQHIAGVRAGSVPGGALVETWDDSTFDTLNERTDNYIKRSVDDHALQASLMTASSDRTLL